MESQSLHSENPGYIGCNPPFSIVVETGSPLHIIQYVREHSKTHREEISRPSCPRGSPKQFKPEVSEPKACSKILPSSEYVILVA